MFCLYLRSMLVLLLLPFLAADALAQPADAPAGEPVAAEQEEEERVTDLRRQMREDFADIGVDEHLGEYVDLNIPFVDIAGNDVTLADYVQGDVPLVITFVYHDCPMLCSMVLDGLSKTLREVTLTLGSDYRALAISIDPRDTPEMAAAAHERYSRYVVDAGDAEAGFIFLTGTEESITAITDATGFRYKWLEDRQEYAHTATVVFLSPEGRITRYLYGLQFPPMDFRRSLVEAGEGTIGSRVDQLFLYCFVWDPSTGGFVLHATNAMKLGGMGTLILLAGALFFFWRREQRVNRRRREDHGAWGEFDDALRTSPSS